MASKQGYAPDLRKYLEKRLHVYLNCGRQVVGLLIGSDKMMNIVLNDAVEIAGKSTRPLGKAMIRGNSIILWECIDRVDS